MNNCDNCKFSYIDFGNAWHCTCNKCELEVRADERQKTIDETLEIINRELALLEERLRIETNEGRWVDEEKCLFAIERLEHLVEQLKGDTE